MPLVLIALSSFFQKKENGTVTNTVTITLTVGSYGKPARGWELSSAKLGVKIKGSFVTDDELQVKKLDAWASPGFSFHCSAPSELKSQEGDDNKAYGRLEAKVKMRQKKCIANDSICVCLSVCVYLDLFNHHFSSEPLPNRKCKSRV